MTKIIGFAGRKQSGKNTSCNFIMANKLFQYGVCKKASLNKDGNIIVSDLFGEGVSGLDWIPLTPDYVNTDMLFANFNICKIYAFADPLKEFCINVLGLSYQQVYGTDADKNSYTHLRWENMPGVIDPDLYDSCLKNHHGAALKEFVKRFYPHDPGSMTAREVLQFVGTEIFRKMYQNVWIDSVLRKIDNDKPELALISDVRFDDEIKSLQDKGGIVIGLLRDKLNSNGSHASENTNFDLCDHVIDNREMDMDQLTQAVMQLIGNHIR